MGSNISIASSFLSETAWLLKSLYLPSSRACSFSAATKSILGLLSLLALVPISSVDAGALSGSVSSSWTFGNYGNMNLEYSFMWSDGLEKNVIKTVSLTLDEAHHGKEIELVYDRILLNPSCPMTKCYVCYGTGKVSAGFTDPRLSQLLTSPCPACAGRKYDVGKNCQPYIKTEATQTIAIPPGVRVGYEVEIEGAGNDLYENLKLSKGNFSLRVDEIVMPSPAFKLFEDRVEATVMMSVKDALKGFVWEQPYLDGHILRIDRSGKMTIPNSTIVMPNIGIYKRDVKLDSVPYVEHGGENMNDAEEDEVDSSSSIHVETTVDSDASDGTYRPSNNSTNTTSIDALELDNNRVDLIVKFELKEMKDTEGDSDDDAETDEINLDDLIQPDGTVEIKNQEDLQRYMNAQNSRNEELSGRQLLYYLARFSRIAEHYAKGN